MSGALILALGAMACFGMADLVYKRAAGASVPAHQLLMVQSWIFAPLILAYGLLTGSIAFRWPMLWGVAAGTVAYAGFLNFAASLRGGAVSVNAPIFRLSFAVTAALAIGVLGEPLTVFKSTGLGLALLATWMLLAGPGGAGRTSRASLVRVLMATVLVGIANFMYKVGLGAGATPATMLLGQVAVVVPLSICVCVYLDGAVRPVRATWVYAPIAAVLLGGAFTLMVEGLARGQASVVIPIAQMGFVLTALVGFTVLGEAFSFRKGVGLLTAIAALACLANG